MSTTEGTEKVRDIIKDIDVCMLTTVNSQGELVSRPMSTQTTDFDGSAWFMTKADSNLIAEVRANPKVNLAYSSKSAWLSVSGRAQVVDDVAKKRELWSAFSAAFMPADNPEDPIVALIRVDGDTAEYWESAGAISTIFSVIKAKTSGGEAEMGTNERVDL